MIALLCSVPFEAETILASMEKKEPLIIGSTMFYRGMLAGSEIALCAGGMGKVNAAHAASILMTRYAPEALIVFGIGGAYPSSNARVGDIALASEELSGDDGVLTQDGFKDTGFIGIPLVQTDTARFFNRIPAHANLLGDARGMLSAPHFHGNVHTGKFITVSTCTGTTSRARELEERYHALCENMEGFAAAQVAELHHVPWLEVRGISNRVEDRDLKQWDIPKAAAAVQSAVIRLLTGWKP